MRVQHPFEIITPTVDGDVLHVLASSHAEFTVSHLARLIPQRSAAGIRNAVQRLTGQGIASQHRVGQTSAFRLNDDHLAAPAVRQIAALKQTLLSRLHDHVAMWHTPPRYGALFGSASRDDMRESSDIDIVLVRPAQTPDADWLPLLTSLTEQLTAWTGNDARIADIDEQDLGDPTLQTFMSEVLRDGLAFTDDHEWLHRTLRLSVSA